jgi:hypothetical protein
MGGVENVRCNMLVRRSGERNQLREVDWMHVLGLGFEEGPGDGERSTGSQARRKEVRRCVFVAEVGMR